jgi:hypothetical protein
MKITMRLTSIFFLATMTSSSDGRQGRLVAKEATSCGRLITCPLYLTGFEVDDRLT